MTTLIVPQRMDIQSLETEMLARVPRRSALQEKVEVMVARWQEFCTLPEEVKARFGYSQDARISGAGYELKRGTDGFDLKEDFHVRLDQESFLRAEADKVGAPEAHRFLDAAVAVYPELDALICDFLEDVERVYGLSNLVSDAKAWSHRRIIRLLHYFGDKEPGMLLGDPHPDKGGFTTHLYESDPGVERLTVDGRYVPMDVEDGETLIFAGLGLQHRSRCAVKAPWHRIVANERTARTGRVAAVSFSSMANSRYYDKARVGRTQGLVPGSTYAMPFPDFDRMFMD